MKTKNGKATYPKGASQGMAEKVLGLVARTMPVQGNIRTDGTYNYVMPNREARRRMARKSRS